MLLDLAGESTFKSRAYANAGRALENRPESLAELIETNQLGEIKGIGTSLQEKIITLAHAGMLGYYNELRAKFPPSLFDMLKIPQLGPKRVKVIYQDLGITTLDQLQEACEQGRIHELEGFGEKIEQQILDGIAHVRQFAERVLLPFAEQVATPLLEWLEQHPQAQRVCLCGSLRRRRETIKDIDLLASSDHADKLIADFVGRSEVVRVIAQGETKARVVLESGLNCDLRVVAEDQFAFAQHYFTGSREHNTAMRSRAHAFGLKLNEYGYYDSNEQRHGAKDETELYAQLELDYLPPELREGHQELEWAADHAVPELIGYDSLRGTLHCHTTASDGRSSLEEMAAAAKEQGYQYLGIADHSKAAYYAHGLDEQRLAKQWDAIDRFNQTSEAIHLLKGTEVDILKDGSLDFAEEVLNDCDYVVASIHSVFNLDEKTMTERLISAIESPGVTFIGHMTGRLLLQREAYHVDVNRVMDAIIANNKWVEINSNPHRLDLDWRHCLRYRDRGVLFCINPDAHHVSGFQHNRYGIDVARKAGLTPDSVANTHSLEEFHQLLAATRS